MRKCLSLCWTKPARSSSSSRNNNNNHVNITLQVTVTSAHKCKNECMNWCSRWESAVKIYMYTYIFIYSHTMHTQMHRNRHQRVWAVGNLLIILTLIPISEMIFWRSIVTKWPISFLGLSMALPLCYAMYLPLSRSKKSTSQGFLNNNKL